MVNTIYIQREYGAIQKNKNDNMGKLDKWQHKSYAPYVPGMTDCTAKLLKNKGTHIIY